MAVPNSFISENSEESAEMLYPTHILIPLYSLESELYQI